MKRLDWANQRTGHPRCAQFMAKDLEILIVNVSNPACDISGFAVPGIHGRISIRGEPSLPGRKLFQPAERKPRLISDLPFASHGETR